MLAVASSDATPTLQIAELHVLAFAIEESLRFSLSCGRRRVGASLSARGAAPPVAARAHLGRVAAVGPGRPQAAAGALAPPQPLAL
eukprot:2156310-Pleurochrysis_carterae.AAC.1